MLAFTDTAFARLCIAASRIDPRRRRQWLQEIAAKLDPPGPRARTSAARRQARVRQRRREGVHIYRLPLRDICVEGLLDMMRASGRLSEREALDHHRVEAELARLLEEQGERWSR
jgi:hypothetical protein